MEKISSFKEYQNEYNRSIENPQQFWAEKAEHFLWKKKWDEVLEWNFEKPEVKWFIGGKLNITENCLDRHVKTKPNQVAIIWEPNNPEEPSLKITYHELYERVCSFSHALKEKGIKKGDRVCIYMPMVPEAVVAVLACARVGAIHSVVFAGFSARSLADRINDAGCSLIITADGGFRGNKITPLKSIADEALQECPSIKSVIVLKRTSEKVNIVPGRDYWWHEVINEVKNGKSFEAEEMDSEDFLFTLYTSGSTGKPKGVVHSTGGYMVYTEYSFRNVFQYETPEAPITDKEYNAPVYWCTADVGWITGHSCIIYGPLLAGATVLMFEGIPTYPDAGRFWNIIDKHGVNIFYTAPTALRSLMAYGIDFIKPYNLSSLKILGSVGEPINIEAWEWYHKNIGKGKCPIVDTWWQTETGGIMISPLAGITPLKPAYATLPLPGIQPVIVDASGKELEGNEVEGALCIKFPWPSIIRTTYGDHERCRKAYFDTFKNLYFTGDGCKRDKDGYYRITGRMDDVLNVSGHRLGTAEIENAINQYPEVVESAVVGFPHEIKGEGIYAYVICRESKIDEEEIKKGIIATVSQYIGNIAKPDKIQLVSGLPKTRSGKIMRRILRKIAEGEVENLGDTSTLLEPQIVEEIKKNKL